MTGAASRSDGRRPLSITHWRGIPCGGIAHLRAERPLTSTVRSLHPCDSMQSEKGHADVLLQYVRAYCKSPMVTS